ncbi:MAG TPA: hypothetical protein VHV79_02745 [Mycobacteriales bacterium]|jgi:hypothetical protein|nr:hypothetical protein [Mycobacteriales bacterium]
MRRYVLSTVLAVAAASSFALSAAVAAPVTGSGSAVPRAGSYAGAETFKPTPIPVQFTVTNGPKTVRSFASSARVKAGCKNNIAGYQAPTGPMKVTKAGRFSESLTTYPGPAVKVTVIGHFTRPAKVTGRITVKFKRAKGCNSSRAFTATRG